jgi:deoxyribonuclease IV
VLLGAHVSTAGGVANAPARGAEIGATAIQLFTKQPNRWAEPLIGDGERAAYRDAIARHGIGVTASHDSYLINLASPDPALRARSLDCFTGELRRCATLGVPYVVTHPGNATDDDFPGAIARNAEALEQALEAVPGVSVLLETTAGAGRVLGASFEQLADILGRISGPLQERVGVCLDSCHVWAAGYDIRDAYDDVLARFDDLIGVGRIRLFHLNDSLGDRGSRRDRHVDIGEGTLGEEPFRRLLQDERFAAVPKVLETPKGDDHAAADGDEYHL